MGNQGGWAALLVLALTQAAWAAGQATCGPYATLDNSRGKPLIFGKPFQAPALHLKFEDETTGKPVSPTTVNVHYYSQWIMAPAIENSWGAWSDVDDWIRCAPNGQSEITVPASVVTTRGWYDGKYIKFPFTLTGSRQPRFDRIEIVIEFDQYAPRLIIKAADLENYRGAMAVVRLPRAGRATVDLRRLRNR